MTKMDQARIAVAAYGTDTYTTADIKRALDGYINTSLCLAEMRNLGEIEIVRRGKGRGRESFWRTIKLRPVKQPTAPQKNAAKRQAVSARWAERDAQAISESLRTQSALRLHAALDKMTRDRLANMPHTRKTNHKQGDHP